MSMTQIFETFENKIQVTARWEWFFYVYVDNFAPRIESSGTFPMLSLNWIKPIGIDVKHQVFMTWIWSNLTSTKTSGVI